MFIGGLKKDLRVIVMDTSPASVLQAALTAKAFENHDEKLCQFSVTALSNGQQIVLLLQGSLRAFLALTY